MVVKIRKITAKGDEQHLLSLEEAAKFIDAEKDSHFVVDVKTMKVLGELRARSSSSLSITKPESFIIPFSRGVERSYTYVLEYY